MRWKYSLFLRFSPWRDPRLRHFSGYPFGTSRKKASTIFYNTAISKGSVIVHGCFVSAIYWKYMLFLQFFRWWALWLGDFIGYFFGIGCVQFYGWWFFQWKSIDKSSFHVWWCGPLSFFVHYMKSSFEELLRDLQIISKELFLSSWNLVSTTNLNTANRKNALTMNSAKGKTGEKGCLFTVLWRWNHHTPW